MNRAILAVLAFGLAGVASTQDFDCLKRDTEQGGFQLSCAPQSVPTPPPPGPSQCSDGVDNDRDEKIDLADPGCANSADNDEADELPPPPTPQCSDGIDNDGDRKIDLADPGCSDPADNSEVDEPPPPVTQCSDGVDNDGDGKVDLADPGCVDLADNSEADLPPPPPPSGPFVGYGAVTSGGETDLPGLAHDVFVVTSLADSGPGSLRDGVINRNRPRVIQFAVGGTITLQSELKIRAPYLTVDGLTAPAPGISLAIKQTGAPPHPGFTIVATHDIIIRGLRWAGTWTPGTAPPVSTATMAVDGDGGPQVNAWDPNPGICWPSDPSYRRRSCRIVLDHNTLSGARDSGTDFWCGINDLTFSHNLVIDSYHPRGTGCKGVYAANHPHSRHQITEYANVYAYNGDRNPKLNEGVYDYDLVNNIITFWQDYGSLNNTGPSGNGALWDDDGAQEKHNVINNVFLPGGALPLPGVPLQAALCAADSDDCSGSDKCREKRDCIIGASCKCDSVNGQCEPAFWVDGLHFSGNVFAPKHNPAECKSTAKGQNPFPRPYTLVIHAPTAMEANVLDVVGAPHKTARETQVLDEVRAALAARVGNP